MLLWWSGKGLVNKRMPSAMAVPQDGVAAESRCGTGRVGLQTLSAAREELMDRPARATAPR
jgi:hypothetical protein